MGASVPITMRMLLSDRRRLAVSLLGVAAAVGLVLLLQAMWAGQLTQITAYEDNSGADLFVAQRGTESVLGDVSVVPLAAVEEVARLPGVDAVDPIHLHYTVFDLHGQKEWVLLVGSEPGRLGGPWDLAAGREPKAAGEAVLDRVLAGEHDLTIGDELTVPGSTLRVVGLAEGTRSWMTGLVFVTGESAALLSGGGGVASYLLVRTDRPTETATAVSEQMGLAAIPPGTLAANDRKVLAEIMESPIMLMIGIAFAAATLVVALTVYSAVIERLREYGIVKAIGADQRRVWGMVAGQALAIATTGSALGFLMYVGGAWVISKLRPQFWFSLQPRHLVVLGAATLAMSMAAAALPVRRLGRLDPASVYHGW